MVQGKGRREFSQVRIMISSAWRLGELLSIWGLQCGFLAGGSECSHLRTKKGALEAWEMPPQELNELCSVWLH